MYLAMLNWQNLGATGKRAIVGRTQRCECLDRAERCYEARSAQQKQKGGEVDKAEIPSSFFPHSLLFCPPAFLFPDLAEVGHRKMAPVRYLFLRNFFLTSIDMIVIRCSLSFKNVFVD